MTTNNHVVRFNLLRRIEHILLIVSFTTLGLTGLIQKYSQAGISEWLVALLGGIEIVRIIHRIAAIMFILEAVSHFIYAGYLLYVKGLSASMLPGLKDGKDVIQFFLHNLNLSKKAPKMGRYNFMEKLEYWALIWGLILMGTTGFMLWNPIAVTKVLPGQFIPAAKVAHGLEAVLAVLAILFWHFYNVHVKSFNTSMFNGKMSRHHMEEEHGEELEQIDTDAAPKPLPIEKQLKRRRIFVPIAAFLTVVTLGFIFWFVTVEDTSLAYVPPAAGEVEIFSPQTPTPAPTQAPTPTSAPVLNVTWDGGIDQALKTACGACHGASGGLSVASYADLLKGGKTGPAVIPGKPDESLLLSKVADGKHPGKFSAEQLQLITEWILAGTPEK
jgi:cytochrome b subunit of formate dehydrogenase